MTEISENKASAPGGCGQTRKRRNKERKRQEKTFHPVRALLLAAVCSIIIPAILITGFFPFLRIYGESMAPTLNEGEIVICAKWAEPEHGQLCAFRYGDRILIKRVIAMEGDTVDMDDAGNMYVNGTLLDEPYVMEKSIGRADISLPMTVPEGAYFVAGDSRTVSLDSRCSAVGCIQEEKIIGRILFRIWPLNQFGFTC